MKTRDLWLAAENQVRNRFSKVFNLPFLYPAVELIYHEGDYADNALISLEWGSVKDVSVVVFLRM